MASLAGEQGMTLRTALKRFYEHHHGNLSLGEDEPAREFFDAHDVAHVIFGCDTSLYGEGSVKIWTLFGTTLGFREHLKGYRKAGALRLAKNFRFRRSFVDFFKLIIAIPRIILRANRMNNPWPWNGFEPFMDDQIENIRKEFNIHILK